MVSDGYVKKRVKTARKVTRMLHPVQDILLTVFDMMM